MKRGIKYLFIASFISLIFLSNCLSVNACMLTRIEPLAVINSYTNNKSDEFKESIIVLLSPYIGKTIENIYGEKLSFDPYSTDILSITKAQESSPSFRIKLEVRPYSSSNNVVGVDVITILISPGGDPVVENYTHIKSK